MKIKNFTRSIYDWMLSWADSKYGTPALCAMSFAESSFFPIPVDPLLLGLSIAKPKRAIYFAFLTTVFSVLGGMFGYFIGLVLYDTVAQWIINIYDAEESFRAIQGYYDKYDAIAVGVAGLTPIPYKIATIAAGVFKISFPVFVIASTVSRGARFFLEGFLVYFFGAKIKDTIDKYFDLCSIVFVVLLILGFVLIKFLH